MSGAERLPLIGRALHSWRRRGVESHATDRRTGEILAQIHDLASTLERLRDETHRSHEDVDRRLRATQALVARTYETLHSWTAEVEAMRAEAGYEDAYAGEPLVSVRIATYNNASVLVERALPSVLRQTYEHWEAVIVGDACTDDTAERVAAIGDPRVRFENLSERGLYPQDETANWYVAGTAPINRALEMAKGAWIAALDHDDEWDDDHIEVLLAEAMRTRAEIVYGKWRMVDAENERMFDNEFGGVYPPPDGSIAFQASICHGKLSRFRYDINAHLADEPGDRNLARRLWDASVRFAMLDRAVATYWFSPRTAWGREWREQMRDMFGYVTDG